jgi:hypothetical protein
MALIDPRRARLGAILILLANPGAAQKPVDPTAVLTRIQGQVTLSSETRTRFRSVRPAAQRQVLRQGEIVHVPAGAQVTLICSTETLVSLTGPCNWVLDATACGRGLPLPESSYRNLTAFAGRILPRSGDLLLELESRYVDVGLGPILLSPRNTAVMNPSPRLVWTRVPDAVEYEVVLRGPVETSIRVAADDVHCGPGSAPWQGFEVCSWAPSGTWPALEPGKPLTLKLGSRPTLAASLRLVPEPYELRLVPANELRSVQERLRQIAALPLDQASRLLLAARAYAQGGLHDDAIAAYDEALQAQAVPDVRVALGDLYLTVGLPALADREYRQALAGAPDPAVQAAAELGRGYVAYFRRRFDDAGAHFEHARELYLAADLAMAAEDARAAAARAHGSP